jgi:hypothetical protein
MLDLLSRLKIRREKELGCVKRGNDKDRDGDSKKERVKKKSRVIIHNDTVDMS